MNVLLIGLRCSGKSTLAPMLAARLGWTPVELDTLTASLLGCSTPGEAFAVRGQGAFREAEATCLRSVLAGSNQVISAGGGTPTAPGAADMIRHEHDSRRLCVLYLRAMPAELQRRMRADATQRPSLTGGDAVEEMRSVFDARDATYEELADMTIEVDSLAAPQVVIRAEKCVRVIFPAIG